MHNEVSEVPLWASSGAGAWNIVVKDLILQAQKLSECFGNDVKTPRTEFMPTVIVMTEKDFLFASGGVALPTPFTTKVTAKKLDGSQEQTMTLCGDYVRYVIPQG